MRKFRKLASKAVAFSMATVLTWSGLLSGFAGDAFNPVTVNAATVSGTVGADTFSWDNATVYFLLTDRFRNGNTANDHSYGRGLDKNGNVININDERATFHGGDFAGITEAIKEGYFNDLGVNALWISAPYEQIHGYIVGGDGNPSFAHYSYHGYYVLDYTNTDANFGTEAEFKELVDTAHEYGLRVVLDVVLNHAGYNSMYDMNEYGFGTLKAGWDSYYYSMSNVNNSDYHSYIDYDSDATAWGRWWGPSWLRSGLPGYTPGGSDEQTMSVAGLPDFKTESKETVGIPAFLADKWTKEGRYDEEVAELKAYLNENGYAMTVTNCISYWLSTWVREYGVDGFRCDTAKHVGNDAWRVVHDMCTDALKEWKAENPDKALDDLEFWMTGEAWNHGVEYDDYYKTGKFDSMINFDTTGGGQLAIGKVAGIYEYYAKSVNNTEGFNILSYMSSHDTTIARGDMVYLGSALLMLPGGVQIYYGDETNRPVASGMPFDGNGGAGHSLRSDMNWNSIDKTVLAHWQKVGTFRNNHIAVGAGDHATVSATSGVGFTRTYSKNGVSDRIAAVIGASANTQVTIDVSGVWANGSVVTNYYDNSSSTVTNGKVTFNSGAHGTILVADPDGKALVSIAGDASFKGTQEVTINIDGADSAIVSVDGGKKFVAYDGDTFEIGSTAYEGDTIEVAYKVENEEGTVSGTATFYKEYSSSVVIPEKTGKVKIKMADGSAPYVYAWEGASTALAGAWPGTKLTQKDSDGYYYIDLGTTGEYNLVINNGGQSKTDDITGLSGEVAIEIESGFGSYELTKVESKFASMKSEARAIKNMTSSDYTSATWKALYAYVASADKLVAQGEASADKSEVETLYNNIVAAKKALVLAAPKVTSASSGSKIVKGSAPCESEVKVVIDGKTYTTVADEITGEWKVTASSNLASTSVVKMTATRKSISSQTASYSVSGGGDLEDLEITAKVSATTAVKGDKIKVTATANGGSGTYKYSYLIHNTTTNEWARVKDNVTSNTYTWTAGSAGTRVFYVEVTDSKGTTVRSKGLTVVTKPQTEALSVTSKASATTAFKGDKIKITATANGGSGTYKYSYLIHNTTTNEWARVKDKITSNTYTWTAGSAGTRVFYVEVTDGSGKTVRSSGVKVTTKSETIALSATSKANATSTVVGDKVTFTATANGGSGSYKYSYIVYNKTTGKWARLKDKITSNTYTWKAGSEGTREFYVDVTDSTGKTVRCKALTVTTIKADPITAIGSSTKSSVSVGDTLKIIGTATGGTTPYSYSIVVYNQATKAWHRFEYSSSNVFTWKASSKGTRIFYVDVKDAKGNVERSNAITVNVK